jgi:hypothetical protein
LVPPFAAVGALGVAIDQLLLLLGQGPLAEVAGESDHAQPLLLLVQL